MTHKVSLIAFLGLYSDLSIILSSIAFIETSYNAPNLFRFVLRSVNNFIVNCFDPALHNAPDMNIKIRDFAHKAGNEFASLGLCYCSYLGIESRFSGLILNEEEILTMASKN